MNWQLNAIDQKLIMLALIEDLGQSFQDITTNLLFTKKDNRVNAKIISKHPTPIIMCGHPVVRAILQNFDAECEISNEHPDGEIVSPGTTLFTLDGNAKTLLMAERTILNFLQRLCAVATLTSRYVSAVQETHMKILDTRKTTPGFRHLEKYAVACGGGVNHRMGLYDAIMVKDTHIDALGGMQNALEKIPDQTKDSFPVIVEVRTLAELDIVLKQGRNKVSRVLLDNMAPHLMIQCVNLCRGVFATEASGNIDLDTVRIVAETGVDFASVGKITHSAGSVDLSMKCDEE